MAFLDELKHFFGLGTPPAKPATRPVDPVPVPVEPASAPASRPASDLPPTPRQREVIFRFIVENMAAYANEREGLPTGLTLWICCDDPAQEDGLNVALYASQPGQFRQELSRHLADQYIKLASGWQFNWHIVADTLPSQCAYRQDNLGLEVIRPDTEKPRRARVRVLTGQTAEATYLLDPAGQTEFRIGRGQTVQTASGRVRTNDIAFLDVSEPGFDAGRGDPNLSVSRQHATIRYDAAHRRYRLMADAGGLPANGNKTKIMHTDETVERADLPGVGYILTTGDQIELGGEAKLLFEVDA